jgi:toxin secretion/phage lysis holin
MENKIFLSKITVTTICALLGDKLGAIGSVLILFIFLMFVDYISGMLAAKKEALEHPNSSKYGWSSKKGLIGIYKKIGYMFTVLVAISTDYLIFNMIEEMGIVYKTNTLFGLMVLVWFILNESLSILENAGRMGVKLPEFLVQVLANMKNDINEKK